MGKGWPHGSLVCVVFLCFCHFPMWCPGSGVVLDVLIPDLFLLLTYIYHESTSVWEITIIRVGLPVKEACFMWTNT